MHTKFHYCRSSSEHQQLPARFQGVDFRSIRSQQGFDESPNFIVSLRQSGQNRAAWNGILRKAKALGCRAIEKGRIPPHLGLQPLI
ncbi:hypothetical protein TNCV_1473991 [Trichonephila clavipes]|nr:hypothetical protein TNCV_1473991 [Trichonephila clavipes]